MAKKEYDIMNILVLNGSPRRKGTVVKLLKGEKIEIYGQNPLVTIRSMH